MKKPLIFLFFISLLGSVISNIQAQETKSQKEKNAVLDSINPAKSKKTYGLRVGADLIRPILNLTKNKISGFELVGDFRFKKDLYIAGELGYTKKTNNEDYFEYETSGSYLKVGLNRNFYKNWLDMDNEIYAGFRFGASKHSYTINEYTVFQEGTDVNGLSSSYFEPKTNTTKQKIENANAQWLSLVAGCKVETFKNLYLGFSIEFSKMLNLSNLNNFSHLYVPGFNEVSANQMGFGFNYTLSYRIPIYKK